MNGAHLHLIVNHLPIVGGIIGTLVLIIGILLKKDLIKQTALGIYIFSSITAVVAFFTGEGAEEVVEDLPGVSEKLIHTHEEMGETFLILSITLGVLSLLAFFFMMKKHAFAKITVIATLLLGIVTVVSGKMVGTSGGEIRHTEIRTGASANPDANVNGADLDEEDEEDED